VRRPFLVASGFDHRLGVELAALFSALMMSGAAFFDLSNSATFLL